MVVAACPQAIQTVQLGKRHGVTPTKKEQDQALTWTVLLAPSIDMALKFCHALVSVASSLRVLPIVQSNLGISYDFKCCLFQITFYVSPLSL